MNRTLMRRFAAGLALAVVVLLAMPVPSFASEPCNPPNIIPQPVCDFEQFSGDPPRQIPVGWSPFILSGNPSFYQDDHSFFGGPNLTIRDNGGTFKVGIYTQVNVNPGSGYRASISWGAPNAPDLFGRQLGIDPTGGTDPTAATVIWGPMHWGEGRILNYPPPDVNIDVRARALGNTMTVFFLTDHPQSSGDNLILVDAIGLYPDESAPAVELPPTPTPTPAVTDTPTPEPVVVAAATDPPPTETPTVIPTDTPTPPPTATATMTPSPTPTATFTPVPTATWTPLPTATPDKPLGVPAARLRTPEVVRAYTASILVLSILSFSSAGIFGSLFVWLRRQR
ncbi:MAG: hypothetical protein IPK16_01245 [Anaerolineales bacterium]|nr:hypothetical protein [Anaerolineales bacterium]